MARRRRPIRKTILIVGEGLTEKAFLDYMKSLFHHRNTGHTVKVIASDGGCPKDILHDATKRKHESYDHRVVFLDSDIPLTDSLLAVARKKKVEVICSRPQCLEGLLLELLGENANGSTAAQLKAKLHPMLDGPATSACSYSKVFTYDLINDSEIEVIVRLREMMGTFSKPTA